jgi:hypothetical protein
MISKKFKHIEDLIEDYLNLLDEEKKVPVFMQKVHDKFKQHLNEDTSVPYKPKDTEEMFRLFIQVKKHEERKNELVEEKAEIENILREFLLLVNGGKISFEKKDDSDKSKNTFLFWLENGKIMSNR